MNRRPPIHLFDLILLLTVTLGWISKPSNTIQAQSNPIYDCLISDSIRIDGTLKWSPNMDALRLVLGEPDTIMARNCACVKSRILLEPWFLCEI